MNPIFHDIPNTVTPIVFLYGAFVGVGIFLVAVLVRLLIINPGYARQEVRKIKSEIQFQESIRGTNILKKKKRLREDYISDLLMSNDKYHEPSPLLRFVAMTAIISTIIGGFFAFAFAITGRVIWMDNTSHAFSNWVGANYGIELSDNEAHYLRWGERDTYVTTQYKGENVDIYLYPVGDGFQLSYRASVAPLEELDK